MCCITPEPIYEYFEMPDVSDKNHKEQKKNRMFYLFVINCKKSLLT